MLRGNWYEHFDEVREATLDLAASLAESYAKRQHGPCGGCRRAGCTACFPAQSCRDQGDFLGDLVKLNLSYVSQLARMGSTYSYLATRALDRFYSYYAPPEACEPLSATCEVKLVGSGKLSARLTVTNSLSTSGKFAIEGIEAGKVSVKLSRIGEPSDTVDAVLELQLDGKPAPDVVEIPDCDKARFIVSLDTAGLGPDKQYRGSLRASLAGTTSVVQIFVDVLA